LIWCLEVKAGQMSTPILAYRHDPNLFINYIGSDPEYYPDGGPVVVPQLHTARVDAHDLDALELSTGGSVLVSTNGQAKALEIKGLGVKDPAVLDTTVIDSGNKSLRLASSSGVVFDSENVTFSAGSMFRSEIPVVDRSMPTFHHIATPTNMLVGSGVLDADDAVVTGSFLLTDADTFQLRTDTASIRSEAGPASRLRFDALHAHEFFTGPASASAPPGSGAVEILEDRIVIRRDVDIVGSIDSIATDSTALRVEDQIVQLAYSDDPDTANRDSVLQGAKTGLLIDTVPGSYADDAAYMERFRASDGTKLFVDDVSETIDVSKARESGLFVKEVAYYLNGGMKMAGRRTTESRLSEPYWNLAGGALQVSRTIPLGDGKAKKVALGFRVVDNGTVEMIRVSRFLAWDAAKVAYTNDPGTPDTCKVMVRYVDAPTSQ
jgi:hypothetical protein